MYKICHQLQGISRPEGCCFATHIRISLVNMNYETRTETVRVLDACQIPKEDIPTAGEYLDAEPGEWDEYIRTLKSNNYMVESYCRTTWSRP